MVDWNRIKVFGYFIVMVSCFVYAGFSLFSLISEVSSLSSAKYVDSYLSNAFLSDTNIKINDVVDSTSNSTVSTVAKEDMLSGVIYRDVVLSIIGFLVTLLAGLSIMALLKEKDSQGATQSFIDVVTTGDEKLLIASLEKAGGVLTQSELVNATGLTKVKIHRVVKRLEGLGIVSKYPFGMTNKVRLEKKLKELDKK